MDDCSILDIQTCSGGHHEKKGSEKTENKLSTVSLQKDTKPKLYCHEEASHWLPANLKKFVIWRTKPKNPLIYFVLSFCPLRQCFLHQWNKQQHWTVTNSEEDTGSSHQLPALKETSSLIIVGSETTLFRNTFLKSETKEMIPESIVLVCFGCCLASSFYRHGFLLLVSSWVSERLLL